MSAANLILTSVVVNTANIMALVEFYRALGVPLESKRVTLGSEIYRAQVGGVELALFGIKSREKSLTPPIQLSFRVKNLKTTLDQVLALSNVSLMMEPTDMPDGRKAIVLDPDGHSIELLEG